MRAQREKRDDDSGLERHVRHLATSGARGLQEAPAPRARLRIAAYCFRAASGEEAAPHSALGEGEREERFAFLSDEKWNGNGKEMEMEKEKLLLLHWRSLKLCHAHWRSG